MSAVLYTPVRSRLFIACLLCLLFFPVLTGCGDTAKAGDNAVDGEHRTTRTNFLLPSADGKVTKEEKDVLIDASHTDEGYIMISYSGDADAARVQITDPADTIYSYALTVGDLSTFPLSGGSGSYKIDVLEHAYDDMYALACSWTTDVTIADEFKPFLYPNLYCWYTKDSKAVQYGIELSDTSSNDLDYVEKVYNYVTSSISYDTELAQNVPTDYIPDIDQTMEKGTGICFDYASLMTAMLRSQGIPTTLEVGYSGQAYHAWISVYLTETGWVDHMISFDGKSWSLMDPTLAASNSASSVKKYVGDGSNYTVKYNY